MQLFVLIPPDDCLSLRHVVKGERPVLTGKKRILIADVDQKLSARIAEELAKDNYEIREVSDLSDSIDPLELFRPDLIIFDYVINGRDPYRKIQRFWNTYHVPAMIISQDDNVISKVMSLEMGADDYLVKPFDMRELVARVHALLRRSFYTMRTMRTDLNSVEFPDLKISLS